MSTIDFNALRDRAYKIACDHGFHDEESSNEHYLMLVITELSEAVEADRKNKRTSTLDLAWAKATVDESHLLEEHFPEKIKDTVEDELADTVIRLLDLAGSQKVNMNGRIIFTYVVSKKKTFTENCFAIIKDIVNYKYTLEEQLNYAIRQVFELASFYDIDLLWHIETKMRYNEHRPKMHGKKY